MLYQKSESSDDAESEQPTTKRSNLNKGKARETSTNENNDLYDDLYNFHMLQQYGISMEIAIRNSLNTL